MLKIINSLKTFSILAFCGVAFISAQNPAPSIPTIYAKADSGKIIINWTSEAINSIDDSTGYRDFEGFRIYKSIDGGATWGGPDSRIYYNGEPKGWIPLAQFDLSVEEDSLFCLKAIDCDEIKYKCNDGTDCGSEGDISECTDETIECAPNPARGIRVSGIDPLAPWVNLGENTGLEYTYTDNDVYNGKEYTYAVVSYDMGLRSYELSYVDSADNKGICTALDSSESMLAEEVCCIANGGAWDSELDRCTYSDCDICLWEQLFDQVQNWNVTNPDHFADANGAGYPSSECEITEINTVTAIPGFYAENVENISFDGVENADGIILKAEDQTVGNGDKSFLIINEADLSKSIYRFEIQAGYLLDANSDTVDVFGGYATGAPSLYVYEITDITNKTPKAYQYINLVIVPDVFNDIITTLGFDLDASCDYSLDLYDVDICTALLGTKILDLPGATYTENGGFIVPEYLVEKFELKYVDDLGYSGNFTEFIDGLKFRFDNSLRAPSSDLGVAVNSLKYISTNDSGGRDTTLYENSQFLNFDLKYGSNGSSFYKRPPYSYSIKFSSTPQYEVARTAPSSGCSDNPENTLLPFQITNRTTGKVVGVYHTDKGTNYKDSELYSNCETCSSTQWCNNGTCKELLGAKDCFWEQGEQIAFKLDSVSTLTEVDTEEYTFDLYLNYAMFGGSPYDSSISYGAGDYIKRSGMRWIARSAISANTEPSSWIDSNDDGENDNPWEPVYAWDDGDELIIEPTNWYVDGDAWIADFSQIGRKTIINKEDLSKISVVPNPYFSHSQFDETANSRLMWFTHLPTYCYISIYTVSGELVRSFEHSDEFSGQESWDLRSGNGDEVSPGLYIFTVESGNPSTNIADELMNGYDEFKHVGKFAIVR
tara:strand:+ start:61 stop:2712 length:2652 start_codon:yes stop_codon:yes gene_type:complete